MPTLEITTVVGCPLMCNFCPQTGLKAAYDQARKGKYLSLDDFKCVLNKLPKHVRIDFSGMAEPWANPQCTNMLSYALEKGFKVAIYTTLYGMTDEDATTVVGMLRKHCIQVAAICVHLPDASENMRGWRYSQEWESVFIKFRTLAREKIIGRF